ncbi:hypothetical protein [Vulcanisaeta sp. JCM 16161]|uniref:hypothetical protein n=1 Tax=Vulcanisaeta sp. JCM 16161 TaxID=1295372 RepID=UPI001FB2B312|nr:hypothetical protein [Vulcanisaeta sp. JCM 16161]
MLAHHIYHPLLVGGSACPIANDGAYPVINGLALTVSPGVNSCGSWPIGLATLITYMIGSSVMYLPPRIVAQPLVWHWLRHKRRSTNPMLLNH